LGKPIPRFPETPPLSDAQVAALTRIVFLDPSGEPAVCDLAFLFGGTHPGLWRAAAEVYQRGLAPLLLVTGGVEARGHQGGAPISEARFLADKLIAAGIPETSLILEERSTNTRENAVFATEVFDFETIESMLLVCKSYAAGRQYRTLRRHLPAGVRILPYPFDTTATAREGPLITREDWSESAEGRARVFGEYLRIVAYGARGEIEPLAEPVAELEGADE
jgi:uncharacterized SAM-binding protein YcdF (DUF218 family)